MGLELKKQTTFGIAKVKEMSPANRLKELKELLKAEEAATTTPWVSLYAQDLKLTIAQVKKQIKNKTETGYQMVEV